MNVTFSESASVRMRFTVFGTTTGRFESPIVTGAYRKGDDPEYADVFYLRKMMPPGYRARRPDRVYFIPSERRWFTIVEDHRIVTFRTEMVGVKWLDWRETLIAFGCDIAGADIRDACFRALYRNRKDLLRAPLSIVGMVDKYGDDLCGYARKMLAEHPDWFALEEREMIEQYVAARSIEGVRRESDTSLP